jgi:hypothetical protein
MNNTQIQSPDFSHLVGMDMKEAVQEIREAGRKIGNIVDKLK